MLSGSAPAPTIYIWVRTSVDWQDESAFRAQLFPELADSVQLWNRTFRLPFHRFRHEVREIARENLSCVAGAVCAPWEAIPDGALVVPVDDDDWFAPELASVLSREWASGVSGYYWPSRFLEMPTHLKHEADTLRRSLQPGRAPFWLCTTNNYALVKTPDNQVLMQDHTRASAWFAAGHGTRVKEIGASLSLMNRTLGSTTALVHKRPPCARWKLLLASRRYRRLYRRGAAPGLAWSQPYQDRMHQLMDAL